MLHVGGGEKETTITTLPQIEERLSTYRAPHFYLYACWLLKVLMI